MSKLFNVQDVAKDLNLYIKVVVSTKSFENFNSFFNIYDEWEEPCRRIVILTPYAEIEEVNDEFPGENILENSIVDGNVWIKEYPLTTAIEKIDFESLYISYDEVVKIREFYNKNN